MPQYVHVLCPQSKAFTVSPFSSRAMTREVLLISNGCCMFSSHSTFQHSHTSFVVDIDSCPFFLRNMTFFLHSSLKTPCILTIEDWCFFDGSCHNYVHLLLYRCDCSTLEQRKNTYSLLFGSKDTPFPLNQARREGRNFRCPSRREMKFFYDVYQKYIFVTV